MKSHTNEPVNARRGILVFPDVDIYLFNFFFLFPFGRGICYYVARGKTGVRRAKQYSRYYDTDRNYM